MIRSEAQIEASRLNGSRSKGPLSPESRTKSARNALKHGLTGQGIVTPEGDAEEIARRAEEFTADMKPKSEAGVILILQMSMLSVRMERAAEYESAAIARNVRHAPDDFDEERIEKASQLFEGLAENPRGTVRKLKKSPEGVDRLIEAWRDLRDDLAVGPEPAWAAEQLERAANLIGVRARHARESRLGALSRAVRGDFEALGAGEGGGLDVASRREWARSALSGRIDAEIAALEAHRETLDFEIIAIDRAEAGARALFDASKPACLARRYESEASRGFFKCLKEFRTVEAEFAARANPVPIPPKSVETPSPLGSFREMPPPPAPIPVRAAPAVEQPRDSRFRGPVSDPEHRSRRPKLPR